MIVVMVINSGNCLYSRLLCSGDGGDGGGGGDGTCLTNFGPTVVARLGGRCCHPLPFGATGGGYPHAIITPNFPTVLHPPRKNEGARRTLPGIALARQGRYSFEGQSLVLRIVKIMSS